MAPNTNLTRKPLLSVIILLSLPKPREPASQCDILVFQWDHREGHPWSSHPAETAKKKTYQNDMNRSEKIYGQRYS